MDIMANLGVMFFLRYGKMVDPRHQPQHSFNLEDEAAACACAYVPLSDMPGIIRTPVLLMCSEQGNSRPGTQPGPISSPIRRQTVT